MISCPHINVEKFVSQAPVTALTSAILRKRNTFAHGRGAKYTKLRVFGVVVVISNSFLNITRIHTHTQTQKQMAN